MQQQSDFTVIYVMARGHSGSTVLDLMLGNHESIQSLGELASGFNGLEGQCSCGASIDECHVWGPIRRALERLHPETTLDDYAKMVRHMDRFYRIPQIRTGIGLPAWVRRSYEPMTRDLYALIARQLDVHYVVDSTKEMGRAYYLLKRLRATVKIIHLVRDGRGVMWSRLRRLLRGQPFQFMRRFFTPRRNWPLMLLTVLSWDFANAMGILLRLLHREQVIQVRYEDLCSSPRGEFARIGEFIGLDMSLLAERIEKDEPFEVGHNIGGNFMRFGESGTFRFRPDFAWRERLPMRYRIMFLLLGFPVALYYGYLGSG